MQLKYNVDNYAKNDFYMYKDNIKLLRVFHNMDYSS